MPLSLHTEMCKKLAAECLKLTAMTINQVIEFYKMDRRCTARAGKLRSNAVRFLKTFGEKGYAVVPDTSGKPTLLGSRKLVTRFSLSGYDRRNNETL